jgi:hypothetical protein
MYVCVCVWSAVECTHRTTQKYSPAGGVTGAVGVTWILPGVVPLVLATAGVAPVICNITEMTRHNCVHRTIWYTLLPSTHSALWFWTSSTDFAAERSAPVPCIREVPGSNIGPATAYPDLSLSSEIPPRKYQVSTLQKATLSIISFPVRYSIITLSFGAIRSQILTLS